jgi:hypothetical protein
MAPEPTRARKELSSTKHSAIKRLGLEKENLESDWSFIVWFLIAAGVLAA